MPGAAGPLDIPRERIESRREPMRGSPATLRRPVLCAPGYRAAPAMSKGVRRGLLDLTGAPEEMIEAAWFPRAGSIKEAALVLARKAAGLRERHGVERLDLVCVSMGGLAARLASTTWFESQTGMRIRIGTLFTLASPHRGALLAEFVRLDEAALQMRSGSAFLRWINEEAEESIDRLICYARTRDWWVGMENTAPPGWIIRDDSESRVGTESGEARPRLLWRATPWWTLAHLLVSRDPAILADIAARLRGEPPLAWAHPDERAEDAHAGKAGGASGGTIGGGSSADRSAPGPSPGP